MDEALKALRIRIATDLAEMRTIESAAGHEISGEFQKAKQGVESAIAYLESHLVRHTTSG